MNILYSGLFYGEKMKASGILKVNASSYAIQKFNRNMIDALSQFGKITVLSQIKEKECDLKSENNQGISINYQFYTGKIGYLKLICSTIRNIIRNNPQIVFLDPLNLSQSIGVCIGKKIIGYKTIAIITDIPLDILSNKRSVYRGIYERVFDSSNAYIFLTEKANEDFNKKCKPYCIIEGIANEIPYQRESSNDKICIYAGGLVEKYHIKELVKAFCEVARGNEYLYLYGEGECELFIKEASKTNKQIVFKGNRPNEEVLREEINAYLLINPRPNIGEYTKYTFPSKVIEYFSTGTPMIGHKLDGIPDIYYNHSYIFSGEDVESYKKDIRNLLDMNNELLRQKGMNAKAFITERNSVSEIRKRLKVLIDEVIEK